MERVLLIGGEGYIGNVITNYLTAKGYLVTSFDKLLYDNSVCVAQKKELDNYHFIEGDICNESQVRNAVESSDMVVVLAGLVGDPITKKFPDESNLINDIGIKNVINICSEINLKRFIFISTCSNYGMIEGEQKANEEFELNPLSLYAESKVSAEKLIFSMNGNENFCPTVLRFATAFGLSPRMRFDLTVNEFIRELALGNELVVFDADTWRPYCHVEDFARLIECVLKAPEELIINQVFNAGGDSNNATKRMIVDKILEKVPAGKVKYKDFGSDPRNYIVDFSKVRNTLDFTPKFSIEMGIDEILKEINKGNLDAVDNNKNFHGNYEIVL